MAAVYGIANTPLQQPPINHSPFSKTKRERTRPNSDAPFSVNWDTTHFNLSLRAQRGNLVAVALVVCRRVFNLNEIATSLRSSQ